MEKQRHRQAAKRELEALAERAETVGDVDRATYLRRIAARLEEVDATPEDVSADRTGWPGSAGRR
jgi:hypothetical protein